MPIAVAGGGDLARYICEEFTKAGHEIVILGRRQKTQFEQAGVSQFITDYTVPSLVQGLTRCDVLISTIAETDPAKYLEVHQKLIEACRQSTTCKRFIPSEFAGNAEEYPDLPGFYWVTREPVRKVLRETSDIEWTIVCTGWLADYFVPLRNRYIKDIGDCSPVNLVTGRIVIPGTGKEPVDLTWVRDVARGLAELVRAPSWEHYTYMSGTRTCWNDVAKVVKQKYPNLSTEYKSYYAIMESMRTQHDEDSRLVADHHMFTLSTASSLPQDKVLAHRQKYFPQTTFWSLSEGLAGFDPSETKIL